MGMSKEEKEKIKNVLEERGAMLPCPRCGNAKFILADGFFNQTVQNESVGIVLGGPSIPSAIVLCTKCGFMMQHSLGLLNIIDKES
jgi:predicted RNA-binding Zn-ribbon protein involved in translation (DUF1610 family)